MWRGEQKHTEAPDGLLKLLQFRKMMRAERKSGAHIKVGVIHVANEQDRVNWPWYTLPDFVLRN